MNNETQILPNREVHHVEPTAESWSTIGREIRDDGILVLSFDRPDSPANIFDPGTLSELEWQLDEITGDAEVRGLVLTSKKPSIFIAGADLGFVAQAQGDALTEFIECGQRVFSKLAALRVPTVAAIHGACLGGGLELALACDYRIASPDKVTKLGLPETQLGILPAWGGSTRLPRLIGLPKALDLILAGKILGPAHARKLGLVDELVPHERLLEFALRQFAEGKVCPKRASHWITNNAVAANITKRFAHSRSFEKTRGNYPALAAAIDVVCDGVVGSIADSLELERRAILELTTTNAAKQLMRIFHLQEHAKKFHAAEDPALLIERTAVVGAGIMGSGIAHWMASRRVPVILRDLDETKVAAGMKRIGALFAAGVKRRVFSKAAARRLQDRISPAANPVPLGNVDLVLEAAVEDLQVKKKIFADLCERVRPNTVLATNTSALPIGELAKDSGVTHPERLIGLHFFNPVHRMKLVEVVVTDRTSPQVVEAVLRFVRRIGKLPVVVRDRPGFLVNRILMPYLIEAGRMLERGIDPLEIDRAMLDFGMPMGPLRLLDEVGLDVALHVARTMESAFGERFAVPLVLSRLVEKGLLGRKAGEGFYRYVGGSHLPSKDALVSCLTLNEAKLGENDIAERLSLLMVNEGFRVLGEKVASSEDDIDFAMILGTGFAPFRGGPMTYARRLGLGHVVERLEAIGGEVDEIFEPATALLEAAAGNP
jgi:3-hydroxyacyl-CoA dehydrogenase/enoyl-CoA hydratase/3-hydroxybutyryl-CoA epimerase